MTYGDRLQQAMQAAKVDRKELARHLGVSVQAVGQVITGDTKAFDATNHTKAFLRLRCDPLWLATGKQSRPNLSAVQAEEPPAPWPSRWQFRVLDIELFERLPAPDKLVVEGAWIESARNLGFSLAKPAAA
jgi:transcriptional regulator with XRE-family HTH domain